MITLITDVRLLKIYNAITKMLGYHIHISSLRKQDSQYYECGVRKKSGKTFVFEMPENYCPDQNTLCHELMHICLCLEGWPIWYFNYEPPFWQREIGMTLFNISQHATLWQRLPELGFVNPEEYEKVDYNLIFFDSFSEHYPLKERSKWLAVRLLHICLRPIPQEVKIQILRQAAHIDSYSTSLAKQCKTLFDNNHSLNVQSSVKVVEECLSMLSMPKDILHNEFPKKALPNAYDQVKKALLA